MRGFSSSFLERCLEADEKPYEVMKNWDKGGKKDETAIFLFKKKIFINDSSEVDKEMEDPVARDLVYQQAGTPFIFFLTIERFNSFFVVSDITLSVYPCSTNDAIKLAGLQMQVTYGDHNPHIHVSGFLL